MQLDLEVIGGDPDLFATTSPSGSGIFPTSLTHQYAAATFGPERLLIPAHMPGRILIIVTSRWPGNTTFRLRAVTAVSPAHVHALALNMDALDPASYTRKLTGVDPEASLSNFASLHSQAPRSSSPVSFLRDQAR